MVVLTPSSQIILCEKLVQKVSSMSTVLSPQKAKTIPSHRDAHMSKVCMMCHQRVSEATGVPLRD